MQRPTFIFALAIALALPALASAQDFDRSGEQQMLARINAMRASQNLSALTRLNGLDAAARTHCADMATQQQLSHVSESSGTPADRARAAGVQASAVAENVALHRSPELAHEALLSSTPHRANMMSADSTHIGLAALTTDQGVYVTQVFATVGPPEQEAAAATPAAADAVPAPPGTAIEAPGIVPQAATPRAATPQTAIPAAPGAAPSSGMPPPGAPPPPSTPPAGAQQARRVPTGGSLVPQPGSNGTVIIHRNARNDVVAYWVHGNGRWWYYPFPPGATPGTHLEPDMSVEGPPPGFPAAPNGGRVVQGPAQRPQARRIPPPPGSQMWNAPPPPGQGSRVVIQPFQGRVQLQPGTSFYAVPPPPMTGRPTRAWRRQHNQWLRAYRRWQREQTQMRRRAL